MYKESNLKNNPIHKKNKSSKNSNGRIKNIVKIIPYNIKDIGLAKLGRDKIGISEKESRMIVWWILICLL